MPARVKERAYEIAQDDGMSVFLYNSPDARMMMTMAHVGVVPMSNSQDDDSMPMWLSNSHGNALMLS